MTTIPRLSQTVGRGAGRRLIARGADDRPARQGNVSTPWRSHLWPDASLQRGSEQLFWTRSRCAYSAASPAMMRHCRPWRWRAGWSIPKSGRRPCPRWYALSVPASQSRHPARRGSVGNCVHGRVRLRCRRADLTGPGQAGSGGFSPLRVVPTAVVQYARPSFRYLATAGY